MLPSQLLRSLYAGLLFVSLGACGGGNTAEGRAAAQAVAAASAPAAKPDSRCPLTLEQVTAVTGTPMKLDPGSCTFFPTNGHDVPHVLYVLQNPMMCTSIKPGEVGFTETLAGLPAREAYVKELADGTHVFVCPNGNARGFDVVVDLKNDKPKSREAAIALAKQVLTGR